MSDTTTRNTRKERVGVVVSNAQDKTIVVQIDRRTTHPLYGKTINRSRKLYVHDESNEAGVGDTVRVIETNLAAIDRAVVEARKSEKPIPARTVRRLGRL